jgi:phosphoribosylpyrophosphate synthetase
MKIIAGNSNLPLAEEISSYLNVPLAKSDVRR